MAIRALETIIFFGLWAIIFYGPWQEVCTAWARQTAFEQRDRLFDLARSGKIPFDSSEYRTIRTSLEQVIRFAHMVTVWRLALGAHQLGKAGLAEKSDMRKAAERITNPDVRNEVEDIIRKTMLAYIRMSILKSVFAMAMLLIIGVVGAISFLFDNARQWCRTAFDTVASTSGKIILLEAEACN